MVAIFVSAKTVPQKRFTVFIREQMEAEPKRKEEIDLLFKNFYFCGWNASQSGGKEICQKVVAKMTE